MGVTARTAVLLAVAAIVACALPSGPAQRGAGAAPVVIVPSDAQRKRAMVFADVVATPESRRLGLGGRDVLPADRGMLFVYPTEEPRTFWMKDCKIGLDIAFIGSDRTIVSVATLGPGADLPNDRIPSVRCPHPVRFVLETNAGWLEAHGVRAGDEVDMTAALAGVEPR